MEAATVAVAVAVAVAGIKVEGTEAEVAIVSTATLHTMMEKNSGATSAKRIGNRSSLHSKHLKRIFTMNMRQQQDARTPRWQRFANRPRLHAEVTTYRNQSFHLTRPSSRRTSGTR